MIVQFRGFTYKVDFKHLRNDGAWRASFTECHVTVNDQPTGILGVACCVPQDQYKKETGRKLALGRALKQLFPGPIGKQARQHFWTAYLQRPRHGNRTERSSTAIA
jgi:hypothetical protein